MTEAPDEGVLRHETAFISLMVHSLLQVVDNL